MNHATLFIGLTPFALTACLVGPGTLGHVDGETDGSTTSDDSSGSTGTPESSGEEDTTSGDGDTQTDEDPPDGPVDSCDQCGPNQFCVAHADDSCGMGFGYSLACETPPDQCDGQSPCATECVTAVCQNNTDFCAPACEFDVGVDVWCDNGPFNQGCDPWDESSCPEGEKCVPWASGGGGVWDTNQCAPIVGDQQPGEPCTLEGMIDDCGADSWCFLSWTEAPLCLPLCQGDPMDPMCEAGYACEIFNDGVMPICEPSCNAQAPDCPEGMACNLELELCSPIFPSIQGDDCSNMATCNGNFFCALGELVLGCETDACCSALCELDDPNACAGLEPMGCVALSPDPPPELENVGVCVLDVP